MTTAIAKKARTKRAPVDNELQRFLESPLFGLWKDREDIGNPAEWVRSIRKPRDFDMPGESDAR